MVFYFVDRVGDTFRWKGENVSTNEVEDVIGKLKGTSEVVVYGVTVEKMEGRAGMAAIYYKDEKSIDLTALYKHIQQLPIYAAPLFVRILPNEAEKTGTYKYKKFSMCKEGFDPNVVKDPLYYRDDEKKMFVKIDAKLFAQINSMQ